MARTAPRLTKIPRGGKVKNTLDPAVLVDFVFEEGLFLLSVKSISNKPVYSVSIEFDKRIVGLEGKKEITALSLFNRIEFLAPQKEIRTLVATSTSYFRRGQPTKISTRIWYQDVDGQRWVTTIKHDLEIYRDLAYVRQ